MISDFFIERPIFSSVISIVISIAGLIAMVNLPVAQYPQITPVQIQVSATYPGASAEVIAQNVGAPIEAQVNGADNMLYMSSTSASTGNYTLTVYFSINTDPSLAQVDVQNRVSQAMAQLPKEVTNQGIQVQKKTQNFLMVLALYSPENRYNSDYIANYANIYVLDTIKRINGANQASIFGVPDYAMRLWLKPDRMAQLSITTTDVVDAVNKQNQQYAVGRIGQSPTPYPVSLTYPVTTMGPFTEPEQFESIILRASNKDAAIVRIKDIGYADLGRKDYSIRTFYQGKEATLIAIYQQPGANAIEVSKQVRSTIAELSKDFPEGINCAIALDTTTFVSASIKEVIHTFFEAVVLVVIVVFVFLHSGRLTIIPTLAVPVSIFGALIGMKLFGMSVNMLTLFGMILAIGLVVDDAIVVVENTERNMVEHNLSPRDAAKLAMKEVTGPVIAIVLVLNAVFIPVIFLGGITGQLYKQFAITISISIIFSGIVALTLSPSLAALLIKPKQDKENRFFSWFDKGFKHLTEKYINGVKYLIKQKRVALLCFSMVLGASFLIFKNWPTAFVPQEDQGYLFVPYYLPDAASLDRTEALGKKAAKFMNNNPAVANVTEVNGYSLVDQQNKTNVGLLFVSFKGYEERDKATLQAPAIIKSGIEAYSGIKEGIVMPINPPAIPGLGVTAGFEVWLQQKGAGNYAQLANVVKVLLEKASRRRELVGVNSTINANNRQLFVDVDRNRSEILGIPVQDVYNTLQTFYGSLYVSQFPKNSRLWQVILQAEPRYRMTPENIGQIYVRNRDDKMAPISAVVQTKYVSGADLVTRFNNFPAAKITGSPAPGYSSGQALTAIQEVIQEVLPANYGFEWAGEAREEKTAGMASAIAFIFGLIFVFLILAAQYESWALPFSIIMSVPFAVLGALLSIMLRNIDNDIYFQIGLLTLVGLSAKNAILIVEFAIEKYHAGMPLVDAAIEAARLRFRPIIMTSFAFILGCVPLALASGASANSRHSIGTGVIGGSLASTVIAILFVPLFFCLLETITKNEWIKTGFQRIKNKLKKGNKE